MKNFTLMLIAAASVFSASAQTQLPANPAYTPIQVELVNPGFEEGTLNGWSEVHDPSNYAFGANFYKGPFEGKGSARMVESRNLVPGNYIYQEVTNDNLGEGSYLLVAHVVTGRNTFRAAYDPAYFSLFVGDQSHDPINEAASDAYSKIEATVIQSNKTFIPGPADFTEKHVIMTTNEATPQLKIGFGILPHSAAIDKGGAYVDSFKLYYFPDCTRDQVNEWLQNDGAIAGVADVEAAPVGDNKYYNLMGVEVAEPTAAGIYIHNGKKFIVR